MSDRNIIPDEGIFNYLTDNEKVTLGSGATFIDFARQDVIYKQSMPSDHIVYVKKGLIKVFKGGRGDRVICIRLAGPGSFVGLSSVFGSHVYNNSASAVEDSEAIMIRKEALTTQIRGNGAFSLALFNMLGKESLDISEKLVNFSMKQLPGRVADLIRYFSEEIFMNDEFTVPLTRQELAELIGTTKESLIRTLNEFKNDKIIDLNGKSIRIISNDLIKVLSKIG